MGDELLGALNRFVEEKRKELSEAERLLQQASKVVGGQSVESYAGMSKRDAAILYLRKHGGAAAFAEMLRDLGAGGCELGARPLSNLKTTITANPKVFQWDGEERVILVESRRGRAA